MTANEFLPEPLPPDPLPTFSTWFEVARVRALQPNPNAMAIATVGTDGLPAVRIVLVKELAADAGYVVFYTNYRSRKGRELEATPRAEGVLHWDHLQRQVRIAGPVVKSPAAESDAYFATRPLESRIGAWASMQSEPLASRETLARQVFAVRERFSISDDHSAIVPRPSHWGGFRLWIDTLELWVEGPGRVHDRARWRRTLTARGAHEFECAPWLATRLNP